MTVRGLARIAAHTTKVSAIFARNAAHATNVPAMKLSHVGFERIFEVLYDRFCLVF